MLVHPAGSICPPRLCASSPVSSPPRRHEQGTRGRPLSARQQARLIPAHLRCGHTYARPAAGSGVGITATYR